MIAIHFEQLIAVIKHIEFFDEFLGISIEDSVRNRCRDWKSYRRDTGKINDIFQSSSLMN